MIEYFFISLAAVFVIINPLTSAFMFASLTTGSSYREREVIARRAIVTSTIILVTFMLIGGLIFQLFNITLAAFRIAGGLILFGIGMNMLKKSEEPHHVDVDEEPSGAIADDISIVPLAIPFISGPGSIATVMILTTEAASIWHMLAVLIAILVSVTGCYYSMVHSKVVIDFLGDTGRKIMTKIFGLILAVIAVQFVINGVLDALEKFLHAQGFAGI